MSDTVFSKAWQEYKFGFGDLNGNFWLGNDIINTLTTREPMSLRIDMKVFNESSSVTYSNFSVENEAAKYRLTVSGYSGLAGDSLITHNGMMFTTKDQDNDANELNCADRYHGGWWYLLKKRAATVVNTLSRVILVRSLIKIYGVVNN